MVKTELRGPLLSAAFLIFALLLVRPGTSVYSGAPTLFSTVTDSAGVFSAQEKAGISSLISEIQRDCNGTRVVVFIENSTPQGTTLEEYVLATAEKNKIGEPGKDNGLLLYIAIKDRKYRWETGYGLEGSLSSSFLGRISRETLEPSFKKGQYYQGILQALAKIKERLTSDAPGPDGEGLGGFWTELLVKLLLLFIVSIAGILMISLVVLAHFSTILLFSLLSKLRPGKAPIERAEPLFFLQCILVFAGLIVPAAQERGAFGWLVLAVFLLALGSLSAIIRVSIKAIFGKLGFLEGAQELFAKDVQGQNSQILKARRSGKTP